jgi:condensin complex subunit 1
MQPLTHVATTACLQLLFTVLKNSDEPKLRATIAIALGDLAFRFPNLIEPWTSHLYGRLRDEVRL